MTTAAFKAICWDSSQATQAMRKWMSETRVCKIWDSSPLRYQKPAFLLLFFIRSAYSSSKDSKKDPTFSRRLCDYVSHVKGSRDISVTQRSIRPALPSSTHSALLCSPWGHTARPGPSFPRTAHCSPLLLSLGTGAHGELCLQTPIWDKAVFHFSSCWGVLLC